MIYNVCIYPGLTRFVSQERRQNVYEDNSMRLTMFFFQSSKPFTMSRARQTNNQHPSGSSQPPPPPPQDPDVDMTAGTGPSNGSMAGLGQAFQTIAINPKEIVCDLLTKDMVTKKGIVIQFLNSNSVGATTMVGVTRISLNDPRRIPAYIMRNASIIRQHAVHALQTHFRMTLCSAGVLETLSPEDYSISFSWASLSEEGRLLTQHNKPDLGLGYGVCDEVLQPIMMSKCDEYPVYVLNCFVQLQDPSRRSTTVIRKAKEEEAARSRPSSAKKQNNGGPNIQHSLVKQISILNENMKRAAPPENHFPVSSAKKQNNGGPNIQHSLVKQISILNENMKRAAPPENHFPVLPISQGPMPGPSWPKQGLTDIPDEH